MVEKLWGVGAVTGWRTSGLGEGGKKEAPGIVSVLGKKKSLGLEDSKSSLLSPFGQL